jgi:hypothetical protein
VSFASGKDKVGITAMLYVRTQNGLDVFFGIVDYLLKLIDGNDAPFVGLFNACENFFQGIGGVGDVSQFDVECGCVVYRVITKASIQCLQGCHHEFHKSLATGANCFEYFLPQNVYQFIEAGSAQDINKDGDIVLLHFGVVETIAYESCLSKSAW